MRLRGDRFGELVTRQLELLVADENALLAEIDEAERAWNDSSREDAEEAYGDYQLAVDALAERLLDVREAYAETLAGEAADAYRASFNRAAARRFRRYGTIASDLEPGV